MKTSDIILIGHRGHPEVIGIQGQISNKITIVENEEEAKSLKLTADKPLAYVTQTTLSMNDTKNIISVGNGTDAIYLALRALNIGPGDEVITVCNSWISTSEVISQTGASVRFVDIEPDNYNIDVNQIESVINKNTKAIIPVHLYGQPVKNMDLLIP